MATFSVTNTFIANTKAKSAEVNQNFTDVLTILQGHHHDPNIYTNASRITNSGIAANANILDTQLQANITRSGLINPLALQVVTVPKGGTGLMSVLSGDLMYGDSTNVYRTLPIGSSGQILKVSSLLKPAWQDGPSAKFGGDGTDGALSITSGTTTVSLASAAVVIKNYTSISITSTGNLAFSNPHANGSIVILRSQGAVTLTSSSTAVIDMRGIGGTGGVASAGSGSGANFVMDDATHLGAGGAGGASTGGTQLTTRGLYLTSATVNYIWQGIRLAPGSGGGAGQSSDTAGGAGGAGAGALLIECNGAFNFTTGAINASGGTGGTAANGGVGQRGGGGGGGGAGGMVAILYNTLTANTGTINTAGGAGGAGGTQGAGVGSGAGGGGAGAGAIGGAGGNGGAGGVGGNGQNAGGNSAGGGGGCGGDSNHGAGTAGSAGSTNGGVVLYNSILT